MLANYAYLKLLSILVPQPSTAPAVRLYIAVFYLIFAPHYSTRHLIPSPLFFSPSSTAVLFTFASHRLSSLQKKNTLPFLSSPQYFLCHCFPACLSFSCHTLSLLSRQCASALSSAPPPFLSGPENGTERARCTDNDWQWRAPRRPAQSWLFVRVVRDATAPARARVEPESSRVESKARRGRD